MTKFKGFFAFVTILLVLNASANDFSVDYINERTYKIVLDVYNGTTLTKTYNKLENPTFRQTMEYRMTLNRGTSIILYKILIEEFKRVGIINND